MKLCAVHVPVVSFICTLFDQTLLDTMMPDYNVSTCIVIAFLKKKIKMFTFIYATLPSSVRTIKNLVVKVVDPQLEVYIIMIIFFLFNYQQIKSVHVFFFFNTKNLHRTFRN